MEKIVIINPKSLRKKRPLIHYFTNIYNSYYLKTKAKAKHDTNPHFPKKKKKKNPGYYYYFFTDMLNNPHLVGGGYKKSLLKNEKCCKWGTCWGGWAWAQTEFKHQTPLGKTKRKSTCRMIHRVTTDLSLSLHFSKGRS